MNMYWWNLRAAKRELSAEPLDSRRLLPYLLALLLLETLVVEFAFLAPSSQDLGVRQWFLASASVVVTVLGCLYIYRQNGGATGQRFLVRFLVLGWVTGIRITVFAFLGFLGLLLLGEAIPVLTVGVENWADVIFGLFTLIYYLYLGHHLGSLARGEHAA